MKAFEEVEVQIYFLTWALHGSECQFYVPAVLPPDKEPLAPIQ